MLNQSKIDINVSKQEYSSAVNVSPLFSNDYKNDYMVTPKIKYTMEVMCEDFSADISLDVHPQFDDFKDAIASCLVAGLKLIDGHELVYLEAISQFQTNLGISASRQVSEKIAEIKNVICTGSSIPHYEIVVPLGLGFNVPCSDGITVYNIQDQDKIKLDAKVSSRGKNFVVAQFIEPNAWHTDGHQCMVYMQEKMIYHLHQLQPEWGMDWEIIRTQWFGDSQWKKKEAKPYVGGGFIPHAQNNFAAPATAAPPKDVAKLPGVDEQVKHPVSGRQLRLWNVIVDLNDNHGWSRDQVADWVETLDVDISFRSEDEQD